MLYVRAQVEIAMAEACFPTLASNQDGYYKHVRAEGTQSLTHSLTHCCFLTVLLSRKRKVLKMIDLTRQAKDENGQLQLDFLHSVHEQHTGECDAHSERTQQRCVHS